MAAFTSWSDLYRDMLNDLASGNWRTKSYNFDGMQKEFVSLQEFRDMLSWVKPQASEEAADANGGVPLRTVARAGDR